MIVVSSLFMIQHSNLRAVGFSGVGGTSLARCKPFVHNFFNRLLKPESAQILASSIVTQVLCKIELLSDQN